MNPPAAFPPLVLRRARAEDAADFARLMADVEVYANLMQLPLPSAEMWRARLAAQDAAGAIGAGQLHVVAERDGRIVGSAGLHPVERLRRRHAAMMGISVACDAQGQGVGHALMQAVCDYADGWSQVLRIELTVFTDNTRAVRLYERFGFRVEGTHRGYALRNGRFEDVFAMARLHPQPPRLAWPDA